MKELDLFNINNNVEEPSFDKVIGDPYSYELRKKDLTIAKFTLRATNLGGVDCNLGWRLPIDTYWPWGMPSSNKGLLEWLDSRFIPKNRRFVDNIMKTLGDENLPRLIKLLNVTLGLSVTDDYWVVPEGADFKWIDYNLYDNDFDSALSLVAFTGYGDKLKVLNSSPEYTTDGALRKCWRRIDSKVYLYKGGTEGASNAGNEPYAEFYSYQVGKAMGINCVPYDLAKFKGILCSTCGLFTSNDYSLVTAYNAFAKRKSNTILELAKGKLKQDLIDMLIFDLVIANEDRHLGNYGMLRDNKTGELVGMAPIYDNGMGLLPYVTEDDYHDLSGYVRSTKSISALEVQGDQIENLGPLVDSHVSPMLEKLVDFKFVRHPKYNWSEERLTVMEKFVQSRAKRLLKYKWDGYYVNRREFT